MALYIDTANLEEIEAFLTFNNMGGVTTNPSILAKEETTVDSRLPQIAKLITNGLLFAQAREMAAEKMAEEAERLANFLPERTVVKLPFCEEGLKAIPLIKKAGIKCCSTAIFNAGQAYLAASAGADWVAVYVSRINRLGGDGLEVVRTISGIFKANRLTTRILAASVKTLDQVEALLEMSELVDVTIGFSLFQNLLMHPATEKALNQFTTDAAKVF